MEWSSKWKPRHRVLFQVQKQRQRVVWPNLISYPTQTGPNPGNGCLVPSPRFRLWLSPRGACRRHWTLASFSQAPRKRGWNSIAHVTVGAPPLFSSLSLSCHGDQHGHRLWGQGHSVKSQLHPLLIALGFRFLSNGDDDTHFLGFCEVWMDTKVLC